MKDIKQRIRDIVYGPVFEGKKETIEQLIEEIIKPLAEEAFEAGENYGEDNGSNGIPNMEKWINEKFGSNKQ